MKIREATKKDIDGLNALLNQLFDQEKEFEPKEKLQKKALKKIINNPKKGKIFLIKQDGKIVAMVNLLFSISTALGAKVAILEDMVVDSKYRSKQLGTKLLDHVLSYARDKNIKRITLLTDCDNLKAHSFYEKFNFKKSDMVVFRRLKNEIV